MTKLKYGMQYGSAQSLAVKHKQQLNSFFDLQLNLIKFSSDGVFQNEEIKNHEFDLVIDFNNKLNTYHSTFHFGNEKYFLEENGSILNYDNQSNIDPALFNVALSQASNSGLNKYFNFNQSFEVSENSKFENKSSYYSKYRILEDSNPNLDFYPNIYIDSLQTYDSTNFTSLFNQLDFKTPYLHLGYLFKRLSNHQSHLDSVLVDHGFSLATDQVLANYQLQANFDYYNFSTYNASMLISKADSSIFVRLLSQKPLISVFTNRYQSNYFRFDTNFLDFKKHHLFFSYTKNDFYFSNDLTVFDNYIYLNQDQHFSQNFEQFFHLKSDIAFKWKWRLLHGAHSLTYQQSSNNDVFRVPAYTFFTELYINPILFEESLDLKLGSTLRYFSSYYANAYSPALANTYLQDDQLVGNFPFLTVYANFWIETVNIEFQLANLFDKFTDESYYVIPNIPYYRSPFQLLVSWQFN
jgi:hypothetical protein